MNSTMDVDPSGKLIFRCTTAAKEDALLHALQHQNAFIAGIAEHRWTVSGERELQDGWVVVQTAATCADKTEV